MMTILWFSRAMWHIGPGSSASDGFLHVLLGLEHVLALLLVGVLAAQIGGRARWLTPVAVGLGLAVSGALGRFAITLPLGDVLPWASMLATGLAVLVARRLPESMAISIAGLMGLLHGGAHGLVVAGLRSPLDAVAYVLGAMVAAVGLVVVSGLLLEMVQLRRTLPAQSR